MRGMLEGDAGVVTTARVTAPLARTVVGAFQRLGDRYPRWPILTASAVAWCALAAILWLPGVRATVPFTLGSHPHGGVPALDGAVTPSGTVVTPAVAGVTTAALAAVVWMLMVVAMMLPGTSPAVRYVAAATSRMRRGRAVVAFLGGYLAVWALAGAPVVAVHLAVPRPGPTLVALVLLMAALWEVTSVKTRALRACHRTRPIRFAGRGAARSTASFGWVHGLVCVRVCGPAMVAVAVTGHPLVLTVAVMVLLTVQKSARHPEYWAHAVAVVGVVMTLGIVAVGP